MEAAKAAAAAAAQEAAAMQQLHASTECTAALALAEQLDDINAPSTHTTHDSHRAEDHLLHTAAGADADRHSTAEGSTSVGQLSATPAPTMRPWHDWQCTTAGTSTGWTPVEGVPELHNTRPRHVAQHLPAMSTPSFTFTPMEGLPETKHGFMRTPGPPKFTYTPIAGLTEKPWAFSKTPSACRLQCAGSTTAQPQQQAFARHALPPAAGRLPPAAYFKVVNAGVEQQQQQAGVTPVRQTGAQASHWSVDGVGGSHNDVDDDGCNEEAYVDDMSGGQAEEGAEVLQAQQHVHSLVQGRMVPIDNGHVVAFHGGTRLFVLQVRTVWL